MIRLVRTFASLRLVLIGMGLLGAGVLINIKIHQHVYYIVAPLALLALSLVAALIINHRLRQNTGLWIFHASLFLLVLLIAYGRLTYFKGRVEISQGQTLDSATVTTIARGPWHASPLEHMNFEQGHIEIDYAKGLLRRDTRSTVTVIDESGSTRSVVIGDDQPLKLDNYRLYTTSNKGFAALIEWRGESGERLLGTVNFPSYPALEWKQYTEWLTPAGQSIDLELKLPDIATQTQWTLANTDIDSSVALSTKNSPATKLYAGNKISVIDGELRLVDVRMWMGYRIFYDPTLPWLFVTAVTGVLGFAWHLRKKIWGVTPSARDVMEGLVSQHG